MFFEHSKDPVGFLNEIQRVGKAGYIESPDAFMERLTCYLDHRLEITEKKEVLYILKKRNYIQDLEIYELFCNKVSKIFNKFISINPFNFHVRYYWSKKKGGIKYKILNPEYIFDWVPPESNGMKAKKILKVK